MRLLAFLVLIVGTALGGGAAYFGWQFMNEHRLNTLRPEFETVRLVAARETLAPGERLDDRHVQWVEWPAASVPDGAFTRTELLFGQNGEATRYVMRTIEPGEPILRSKVTEPGGSGRFLYTLPPDMRAVSFPIDSVSGVSGFVAPGDHVDILLVHKVADKLVSRVVLQDVEVLAVDQSANPEEASPRTGRTATVKVTVGDAHLLNLAQQMGRLSLMLRGRDAPVGAAATPVDSDALDGLPDEVATPQKTVRVRRGNTVVSEPIE